MITAIDTNILLDLFLADPKHGRSSASCLRGCAKQGRLVVCEVVRAEICSVFPSPELAATAMERLGVEFEPMTQETSDVAGMLWRSYRESGGPRNRIVADFLIGAHALRLAEQLLTRDRGFYREYFEGLTVLDPSME